MNIIILKRSLLVLWLKNGVLLEFICEHLNILQCFAIFLCSLFCSTIHHVSRLCLYSFCRWDSCPVMTARISLPTFLGKAHATFFTNPLTGLLKQFLSWKRFFSYLQLSYVVGYLCCFLWECCCLTSNLSSPKARTLSFNKKKIFLWVWFDYLLLYNKPPWNLEVYNTNQFIITSHGVCMCVWAMLLLLEVSLEVVARWG